MYVSGWCLDVDEKISASNDWIGCNFKLFRGLTFMNFVFYKKLQSTCLNDTSKSKFCLKTFLSHTSVDCHSK